MSNSTYIQQSRKWFICFYPEWLSEFENYDTIENWLNKTFNVVSYAFILHNNDFLEDSGEIKKAHYHIFLEVKSNIRINTLMKRFNSNNAHFFEICKSVNGCLGYLIHKNEPLKAQYKISDIRTNIKDIEDIINLGLNDYDRLVQCLLDFRTICVKSSESVGDTELHYNFFDFVKFARSLGLTQMVVKNTYFVKLMLDKMGFD